ncbi:hypothetical protein BN7874_015 [Phage NCTB]|jgi:hypothetical protein|nr:hypothetical protein BN7874_015 [Phage NCTB]
MPKKPTTKKTSRSRTKTSTRKPASKPAGSRTRSRKAAPKRSFRVVPLKANIVEQPPETELTRKGLTLRKLLRTTPKWRKETGKYEITLKKFKKQKTKTGLTALTAVANHKDPFMPNKTIKDREVYIIGLEDQNKPVNKQRRVMVSCNCEDWVYHGGEYAAALHGAARIIYGNGEPPVLTNPGNVPFLCKHLVGFAHYCIDKGL